MSTRRMRNIVCFHVSMNEGRHRLINKLDPLQFALAVGSAINFGLMILSFSFFFLQKALLAGGLKPKCKREMRNVKHFQVDSSVSFSL